MSSRLELVYTRCRKTIGRHYPPGLVTRGYAFWGIPHLRRLLDWSDKDLRSSRPLDRVDEGLEGWNDDIGGTLAVIKYTESLTRHLIAWEIGFSRLARLDCRIDTEWSDSLEERQEIAVAVACALQRATGLEQLDLVFHSHASSDNPGTRKYHDHEGRQRLMIAHDRDMTPETSRQLLIPPASVAPVGPVGSSKFQCSPVRSSQIQSDKQGPMCYIPCSSRCSFQTSLCGLSTDDIKHLTLNSVTTKPPTYVLSFTLWLSTSECSMLLLVCHRPEWLCSI